MIGFVIIAAVMVVLALLWVLPPLLRGRGAGAAVRADASNLAILKDQLAELQGDLAAGTLLPQQYQQAREELERRVLEEGRDATGAAAVEPARARTTALALGIVLPLAAAAIYALLGSPDALTPRPGGHDAAQFTSQEVEAMVAKLAARLEQAPDDGNGWALLARSYLVMKRYPESVAAYERALAVLKDDADLLADYADASAVAQGGSLEGKPLALIERALKIDPQQWKALALAGTAAFNRKEYPRAIDYWERLRRRAEPGSEMERAVASNIEEARELGGIAAAPAAAPPAPVTAKSGATSAAGGASVAGVVNLSGALAGKVAPTDTVFIYARAAEGPRMPLAIRRFQVKDLPAKFHLDDSLAMSPAMTLSKFSEVVVGARVSKSGSATPQSGDLQGDSGKIKVGARDLTIVIDQVVP